MILRAELGKSRLWIGQPLVVSTKLEFEPARDDRPPGPSDVVRAILRSAEGSIRHVATPLSVNLPPGVTAVETIDIVPGAYEVELVCERAKTILPEFVWLLSREDYRTLNLEEAEESFGFEPLASTVWELEELLGNNAAAIWPGFQSPFKISWSPTDSPIFYPPLQWTSEAILQALKYLSAFGVLNLSGFLSIAENQMEMGVDVQFEYPIPSAISDTFHDKECSDLYLLNANNDLGEFDVDIEIRYDHGRIAVRQSVPAAEYA